MPASYRYPNILFDPKPVPTEQPSPTQRFVRTNFIGAGIDNYSQAPAQDPQMFEVLNNVLPITTGVIEKRWGYSFWNNPSANPAQFLYDYLNNVNGSRAIILSAASYVAAYKDDGSVYNPNLFTPAAGSIGPREVTSRGYAYFSDGLKPDYLKWNGAVSGGVTNWGISTITPTAVVGPNGPGTATDIANSGLAASIGPFASTVQTQFNTTVGTDPSWINPSNVEALDGVYTTCDTIATSGSGNVISKTLQTTGYNFTVPNTATIVGISASITHAVLGSTGKAGFALDDIVQLVKGGAAVGANYAASSPWSGFNTPETFTYGSSSDLWGTTWTPADINASDFGLAFAASAPRQVGLDYISLTIYYTGATPGMSWANPNNILADDGAVSVATATTSGTSQLTATNFGFAIGSTAVIQGIQVDIKCDSVGGTVPLTVGLVVDGSLTIASSTEVLNVPAGTLDFITFGGPNDLWGNIWTPADINATGFGTGLIAFANTGSATVNVDFVRITIYLSTGAIAIGSPGVGNITLIQGRVYFAVFNNSQTGHYSDLNQPSLSTGPLTNNDQPISNIPVSADPQVTNVIILATADGGDETTLYFLASLPNGTTVYTDNTAETSLLANPILLSTDVSGNEFGVSNNDPPPVGTLYPTLHRGNLAMINGPTLYWSKSLTEVTTSSGFIAGRWEEAWPPANSLNVGQGAEDIRGLLSDGINLYIGTEYKIRRVIGSLPSLEDPDIVHNEVGLMNQDVWKIVFSQGTPMGAMWLTPDKRVIGSDFNTYTDIGTVIQGTLNTLNTNTSPTIARASFYSNEAFDLYILGIPTGTSPVINTLLIYNLRTQTWVTWQLADTLTNLFFHIQANGVPQLLLATLSGNNYYLDPVTSMDRNNAGAISPVPIVTQVRTSWLELGDAALYKVLNEIEVQTGDIDMTVTVEGSSIITAFTTPNTVVSNRPLKLGPRGTYKLYLASSISKDRYYRLTFNNVNPVDVFLGGYNIESVPFNRI